LAHRHVARTLTSTTRNTQLTKIDETALTKNEDNDLDVFELLPSDRHFLGLFRFIGCPFNFLK